MGWLIWGWLIASNSCSEWRESDENGGPAINKALETASPEASGIKYTGAKLWMLWIFLIGARVSRFWYLYVDLTDPCFKK